MQKYRELSTSQHTGGNWTAGVAGKDVRELTQLQLNFNPGLVVVAEALGAEAFELIRAANSGCGFMTTVHSLSATEAMNTLPSPRWAALRTSRRPSCAVCSPASSTSSSTARQPRCTWSSSGKVGCGR